MQCLCRSTINITQYSYDWAIDAIVARHSTGHEATKTTTDDGEI